MKSPALVVLSQIEIDLVSQRSLEHEQSAKPKSKRRGTVQWSGCMYGKEARKPRPETRSYTAALKCPFACEKNDFAWILITSMTSHSSERSAAALGFRTRIGISSHSAYRPPERRRVPRSRTSSMSGSNVLSRAGSALHSGKSGSCVRIALQRARYSSCAARMSNGTVHNTDV